jgi:cupin 2 domain-containing protein
MTITSGNLLSNLLLSPAAEVFEPLLHGNGIRLERILSTGQATPPGEWLVQSWEEWVVLIAGEARLLIEGEAVPRELRPDDWINIPAGVRHRVEWTSRDAPTVWLALHYHPQPPESLI